MILRGLTWVLGCLLIALGKMPAAAAANIAVGVNVVNPQWLTAVDRRVNLLALHDKAKINQPHRA
jgi:hypothetical protein